MDLIECKHINRYFGSGENRVHVLKDVSLSIKKGDFVAIIGQSGSGKSTLMNILGCLDAASSGSYRIDGIETAQMQPDELAGLRRQRFGFIFQRYNLLNSLNARDNVALPAVYAGMPPSRRVERAEKLLHDFGLAGKENNRPNELSGGQQQRVSIARALMNGGEIILADEPTGALDSKSGENVMEVIHGLHRQGHTVIMVTHDPKIAAHANRVIEISDGRIIADNSKADVEKRDVRHGLNEQPSWSFYYDQFVEALKMSVQAVVAHKMRSLLTMLGIIIGIAAVVSVVALGKGSQEKILSDINAMGTNTISIYPGRGFGDRRSMRIKTLTIEDAQVLAQQAYVENVTPQTSSGGTLTYRNTDLSARLYGVGSEYFDVRGLKLESGRLFDADNVKEDAQVVVIDQNTKNKLFGEGEDPLGKVVLFRKRPLLVVGVLQPENNMFGGGSDTLQLFVPYTTVMHQITGESHTNTIIVRIKDDADSAAAESGLTELLTARHGTKDFFMQSSDSIKQTVESTTGTMTLLISSIALISLVVGGIGVMNIMLVSVTERTKEIGVRMAIGARRSNILQQFLIEAVLICLIGGLAGILLSAGISVLFNQFVTDFAMRLSVWSVLGAVACSTLIGVVFGFMPADRASRLNPIEALARD
ncbi:MacB family efflux pump subunit [Neisseria weaveri]|uniref:MacB family efflux pump subunit n=1 Tax=Neisseria weaveri TaxID=28091 RepID=UPI000D312E6E|nr:MacB family efflux pump subunit [Neisseria weaveri]